MSDQTIKNLLSIQENIKKKAPEQEVKIIAVSKTFDINFVKPLIKHGHIHFGENKVQEAEVKWKAELSQNKNIKLHMLGHLQTNKAKNAVELFHYIHSLDSQKLADALSKHEVKLNKKLNYFIQVNIGNESQKYGVLPSELDSFYNYCKQDLRLNVLGLMAIPPNDGNEEKYFKYLLENNLTLGLSELSMGMSSDYLISLKYQSTYLRLGTAIFGTRTKKL